jgi:hypothetical protein
LGCHPGEPVSSRSAIDIVGERGRDASLSAYKLWALQTVTPAIEVDPDRVRELVFDGTKLEAVIEPKRGQSSEPARCDIADRGSRGTFGSSVLDAAILCDFQDSSTVEVEEGCRYAEETRAYRRTLNEELREELDPEHRSLGVYYQVSFDAKAHPARVCFAVKSDPNFLFWISRRSEELMKITGKAAGPACLANRSAPWSFGMVDEGP